MRSKWLGYSLALLATMALVTASIFTPSVLLHRSETALLGHISYINSGNYPSRTLAVSTVAPSASPTPSISASYPTASGSASTPVTTGSADATADIYHKILIFERNSASEISKELSPSDISMKTATLISSKAIMEYMKADAIPPLPNFPSDYKLTATPETAISADGSTFDFWSVSFTNVSKQAKTHSSISLMMDAETGAIYSIKMFTAPSGEAFQLQDAATYLANYIHVDGALRSPPTKATGEQRVLWVSSDKSLYLSFYYNGDSRGESFTMSISTYPPSQS